MKKFRVFYLFGIQILIALNLMLFAWNQGFDTGKKNGYDTAVLENKVEVECKFQTQCQKDYDRGYYDGLQGFIEMQCGPRDGDPNEPDSVTL